MQDKIVVGPINKGLRTDRLPFVIDNDSFPTLVNAYQWRGRIRRKRGTTLLNRLTRFFNSTLISYSATATVNVNGSGRAQLITGFGLQTNASIIPGSVILTGSIGAIVYTDPTEDGFLTPTGTSGPNTINYASGQVVIPAQAGGTLTAIFLYYPDLPVMGIEDLSLDSSKTADTLLFDTVYSYAISSDEPYDIHDVSFYKNPLPDADLLPNYVPKTDPTPVTWNGKDYQQFWTVNYQGALWATNGVGTPFSDSQIGMQFNLITNIVIDTAGNGTTIPAVADITIVNNNLVVGDFVFINEVNGITGINFQTGYVTAIAPPNVITVTFPFAILGGAYINNGIAQYLTNRSDPTVDCIRWYDGDPTNANAQSPSFLEGFGWVNFMPPISRFNYSLSDLPERQYYLVGARLIQPFKDRLLFLGPVVQTSTGSPIYLPDTIVFSQNGTPYYTASFHGDPSLPTTEYSPVLVPTNQTATPSAYWSDQTGFGGWIQAGVNSPIISCASNEDVLILGFKTLQSRLVYTGNDILPFNFYLIDSELPTGSTFSAINMGSGIISRGERGIIITTQREAKRIDLDILDQIFEIGLLKNGSERFTAQRDFVNEWIYFTYRSNQNTYTFPNQTLLFNYRDDSWAIFNEAYTTYGQFRQKSGFTWATIGRKFPKWKVWNVPWNAGETTELSPDVAAGNQQGFVFIKDDEDGTGEANSLYIQSISGNTVTSPFHCLNEGDYIVISGVLGMTGLNGNIFSVSEPSENTFDLNPSPTTTGNYSGGGLIQRMYVPFIQTKQFPVSWGMGRKTRIGIQKYLLSTTDNGQIQLLIFLSQDSSFAYNSGNIVPQVGVDNGSLIYSTTLYTCPESTNLGLTPANKSLMMISDNSGTSAQEQIWHRINTSLIGDTIQLGFTMSDDQMRDTNFANQFSEIELHGFIMDVFASQQLC